jgi:drug/metabolite transporter (DMT)-like permease
MTAAQMTSDSPVGGQARLSRPAALVLLALIALMWGINWPVIKLTVQSLPPLWMTTLRCAIAAAVLLVLQLCQGSLVLPRRGDVPIVVSIALLHMVAFATLIAMGMQFVSASRAVVLGYTTPLWVAPLAYLFLGERSSVWRVLGVVLGLGGLMLIFNPLAFDWNDRPAVIGNGFVLLAALFWSINIIHIRGHRWVSSPFQLVLWEVLLAGSVMAVLALIFEGVPQTNWTPELLGLLLYGGVFGTALAFWAMVVVTRSLPAITTSLGLLATPIVGIVSSALWLREPLGASLVAAVVLMGAGIVLGTLHDGSSTAKVKGSVQ